MGMKRMAMALALLAAGAAGAEDVARRVGAHGDWAVFAHRVDGGQLCWVATTPVERPARFEDGQTTIMVQSGASQFSVINASGAFRDRNGRLLVSGRNFAMVFEGPNGWSRYAWMDAEIEGALRDAETALIEVGGERIVFRTGGFADALEEARALCGMV